MKCFYHPDLDAVGLCSQCGKAACRQCVQDVDGSMLCRGCLQLRQREVAEVERVEAEKAQVEIHRAKGRIRRNWIITAVASIVVCPALALTFSEDPSVPAALKLLAGALGAILGPYLVWTTLWGVPAVWRWWRGLFSRIGCFLIANPFTLMIIICATFMIPISVGYMYGALGGGIYQYLKARKIAKSPPLVA